MPAALQVSSDGQGVIIFGGATPQQWEMFHGRVLGILRGQDFSTLTLDMIEQLLITANLDGMGDRYNSDRAYVDSMLVPVRSGGDHYGLYRRRGDQECRALYVEGSGTFTGKCWRMHWACDFEVCSWRTRYSKQTLGEVGKGRFELRKMVRYYFGGPQIP